MATGDKLVNLDELKLVYDKTYFRPVSVQISTSDWSGSGTKSHTIYVTGVTSNSILNFMMDGSVNYLKGDLTITPGSGIVTFSTSSVPSGTINGTLLVRI